MNYPTANGWGIKQTQPHKAKSEPTEVSGYYTKQKINLHSSLGKSSRKITIEKSNKPLTITKQCELAGINKSSLYSEALG